MENKKTARYWKMMPNSCAIVVKETDCMTEIVRNNDFFFGIEVHRIYPPRKEDSVEITEAQYNRLRKMALAKLNNRS
jgi:hypothetical protein